MMVSTSSLLAPLATPSCSQGSRLPRSLRITPALMRVIMIKMVKITKMTKMIKMVKMTKIQMTITCSADG